MFTYIRNAVVCIAVLLVFIGFDLIGDSEELTFIGSLMMFFGFMLICAAWAISAGRMHSLLERSDYITHGDELVNLKKYRSRA